MRRPQIDPKTLKKHSDIVQKELNRVVIAGNRHKTDTGYKIYGTRCKDYETYFEAVMPGQASSVYKHDKKSRSYRVLAGQGVLVFSNGESTKQVALLVGEEVRCAPGISFQVVASPKVGLELFVTQAAKYEARLEEVEASRTSQELNLPQNALKKISREEAFALNLEEHGTSVPRPRRRGNKAAQQQLRKAVDRAQRLGLPLPEEAAPAAAREAAQQSYQPVKNVAPTMGNIPEHEQG